jgi:predicted site-specific integrase-resolvase
MEKYLTKQETADLLRVEIRTLDNWAKEGKPPKVYKINGRVLYDRAEVIEAVKGNK